MHKKSKPRTYKKNKFPKKFRKLKKSKSKKNAGTLKKFLSKKIKSKTTSKPITLVLNPYLNQNNFKNDDIILTQGELNKKQTAKEKLRILREKFENPQNRIKIYSDVNKFNPEGLDPEDITDVIDMTGVKKSKAIQALRQNNFDPIVAIIKLNEIDLDPEDIKLVMGEANVSEFEATYYLKRHNGNYLNAITEAMSN
jgi:NACalpha-BTF3-like transcription factor